MKDRFERAIAIFQENNSMMRTRDAITAGIHSDTLYSMRQRGIIEQVSRGLYRLTDGAIPDNPDIVTVSMKIPGGVICLISALSFYELTLQIPHEVYVALLKGAEQPRLEYPPVRIFRFTGDAFSQGIEIKQIDNIPVKIYSMEKTIADTFKFRNRIGLDTATEALRAYMERKKRGVHLMNCFSTLQWRDFFTVYHAADTLTDLY
jgi:predicted transcriptional regulator of viral defense system